MWDVLELIGEVLVGAFVIFSILGWLGSMFRGSRDGLDMKDPGDGAC